MVTFMLGKCNIFLSKYDGNVSGEGDKAEKVLGMEKGEGGYSASHSNLLNKTLFSFRGFSHQVKEPQLGLTS